ncbi:MAG TPA: glycoside hydrolase 43 family protein [Bacteroidales bacterium]|nr:glycoside hydrolase 43 family protein [Bacteroidales bacterium]
MPIQDNQPQATNPIIWADVPDPAIIRVGDTYYMASTTMHMKPGLPIMRSKDLVNWEIVSYAYQILADSESFRLENGKNEYSRGTWAPSLRYHNGTFYASTHSFSTGETYIFSTTDIESGKWKKTAFTPAHHDQSLFFDDDGRVYMIYAGGNIRIVELLPDVSGIKPGGLNQIIIPNAGLVAASDLMLHAEGSHMLKHDGKYYVFNITWPRGGMRTAIVHRAANLTGPWEGRVILQDRGIAQGSVIQTPDGRWYAYKFRDYGAVGRIPYLIPMKWVDGWPVLGTNGVVPDKLDIAVKNINASGIVATDEFSRRLGDNSLPLAWQWNHNPDPNFWSLSQRRGFLRLTTGRVDDNVLQARNTLTQRTFGPESSVMTAIEITNMKDGDYAGLMLLQARYGFVGVKRENGALSIVKVSNESGKTVELANVPINQYRVYLKIECDFKNRADRAYFYYSIDDRTWVPIGPPLQMEYTLEHFMGARFGLFNFATQAPGGFVDFAFYRVSDVITVGR